jgi:hypothetical protein
MVACGLVGRFEVCPTILVSGRDTRGRQPFDRQQRLYGGRTASINVGRLGPKYNETLPFESLARRHETSGS